MHDPASPQGRLFAIENDNPTFIAESAQHIFHNIQAINKDLRDNDGEKEKEKKKTSYCLRVPFPSLAALKEGALLLVDSPGYGEGGKEGAAVVQYTKETLSDISAAILVIDATHAKSTSFEELLKDLMAKRPQVFTSQRLYIVVNKKDTLGEIAKTRAEVTKFFKQVTGVCYHNILS